MSCFPKHFLDAFLFSDKPECSVAGHMPSQFTKSNRVPGSTVTDYAVHPVNRSPCGAMIKVGFTLVSSSQMRGS